VNPLRFDVMLTCAQPPGVSEREVFSDCIDATIAAEEFGYDGVWLIEHHFTRYGLCASAITLAGHLLGRTTRIRVGSAVTVLPLEHPIRMAERVAMLDIVSDGRFDFGIGRGAYVRDFDVFDEDIATNHLALLEKMDQVFQAWKPEPYPIRDRGDGVRAVPVNPSPISDPHPPVYIASGDPDALEWAAKRGVGLLLREGLTDEQKIEQLSLYDKYLPSAAAHQAAPGPALTTVGVLDDGDGSAVQHAAAHLSWWIKEGATSNGLLANRDRVPNYDRYYKAVEAGDRAGRDEADGPSQFLSRTMDLNLIGSPQRCRERLVELIEKTGLRHIIVGFEANPREQRREQMARFMDEVLTPTLAEYADTGTSS
jgi:alkanesulfonate monooxygenase SsuD/methylene tetrahydromethanopterin reductase-like flavin-dependent oxidoreductase (luciferase family)